MLARTHAHTQQTHMHADKPTSPMMIRAGDLRPAAWTLWGSCPTSPHTVRWRLRVRCNTCLLCMCLFGMLGAQGAPQPGEAFARCLCERGGKTEVRAAQGLAGWPSLRACAPADTDLMPCGTVHRPDCRRLVGVQELTYTFAHTCTHTHTHTGTHTHTHAPMTCERPGRKRAVRARIWMWETYPLSHTLAGHQKSAYASVWHSGCACALVHSMHQCTDTHKHTQACTHTGAWHVHTGNTRAVPGGCQYACTP